MAFSIFSCHGVELEYMIVRRHDLAVAPWSDRVLRDAVSGAPVSDIERGDITWSNELTAHVIELKTTDPIASLGDISESFAREVREINARLAPHDCRLLPTAMHPLMRPDEARLWTHDNTDIYAAFDRIFDCRGHGWSNLQSVHLNLPFDGDAEFARLHAAIRLILPILPALAASSPIQEGRITGTPDNRLAHYRVNSAKLPALCGRVIPEPVYSQSDYRQAIFDPIREQLAPHDPEGLLLAEFSNSRGAIARFDRGSIEIRLLDIQECPSADLAIVKTLVALLKELVAETHLSLAEQQSVQVEPLAKLFNRCVEEADAALVEDPTLLRALGCADLVSPTAHNVWRQIIVRLNPLRDASPAEQAAQKVYLDHGTLARRIVSALPSAPTTADLTKLYTRLADGLETNTPFRA